MILPTVPITVLDVVLWAAILLLAVASLTLASVAIRRPRRPIVYAAAGTLVTALVCAALLTVPTPGPIETVVTLIMVTLAVIGGGTMASTVLDIATGGSVTRGFHGGILVAARGHPGDSPTAAPQRREIMRGGATIGVLERLSVAAVILAGYPEGLAVIIAIKGVGRFTELGEAAEARERFIIGTLTSWLWAASCAGVVLLLR
ncbi:hypothetical protein [Planctomonas psychrotolerans]|uniref:hypothetical protein n=1 Tax=Planctomonas psychrotolerans TaxID=2528712 RepID=UPI001239A9DC|nr:hypothetical protein [Planctomonas psychrotolerans]